MKEDLYLKSPNHDVITLYIRATTDKQKILNLLKKEEVLIDNIKSRVTREGIKSAFQKLKTFISNMPYSNSGYIIVASSDKLVYANDISIDVDKYSCGNEFYAVPLEKIMLDALNPFGIIVLDTSEATLAYVANGIEILRHMTSGIEGKSGKGGQSQRRFERNREQEILMFFSRIGDAAKVFVTTHPISHLLIGGSGMTKDDFLKTKYLDYRLKEKVLGTFDTQYAGEDGIREVFHMAIPKLEKNAFAKEVQIVNDFFDLLGKDIDKVVYGKEDIDKNLKHISIIYKLEELPIEYPDKKVVVLRFKGEHYDKIKGLGGIVGIKVN